jgi:hypothetical protein
MYVKVTPGLWTEVGPRFISCVLERPSGTLRPHLSIPITLFEFLTALRLTPRAASACGCRGACHPSQVIGPNVGL